jgi:signal transduction histidine kinase
MDLPPTIASRRTTERVIAAARLALASASLFGVYFDPAEPARYVPLTYGLHAIFLAYALALLALVWLRNPGDRLPLVTHINDIVFVSVLQYLTLGPSSPFFLYFVFSLFCAAMRWGWQGTLATASVVITAYVAMSVSMTHELGAADFEFDRFLIRVVYLAVSAAILVYLGKYEARLRGEIERLARWPGAFGENALRVREQVIEHAASIVGAGQAVAVWSAGSQGTTYVARWSQQGASSSRLPPAALGQPIIGNVGDATLLFAGPVTADSSLVVKDVPAVSATLHPDLLPWLTGEGFASAAFRTERVRGRAFFSQIGAPVSEIVPLTEIVARQIGASFDQLFVTEQMQEIAASEERIRVARDLHDGVLQSLTGIRLEIRATAAALDAAPTTRDRLFAIERALAIEQRELRLFIGGLRPTGTLVAEDSLASRLAALQERIALEWKAPVSISFVPGALPLPERIERAVPLMVHEAIVNALKHGEPSRVSVIVDASSAQLHITVVDDGRGFPFRGRYDHAALAKANTGPKSLLDRVTALGGRMVVDSTESGSSVEMMLAL